MELDTSKGLGDQIQELTTAGLKVIDHDKHEPVIIIPPNYKAAKLEEILEHPKRVNQSVELLDADSFIAYWNKHKTENSVIFCGGYKTPSFEAVIDYHSKDNKADWLEHTAKFTCPISSEWDAWLVGNKGQKTQLEFAYFIEDNVVDIVGASDSESEIEFPENAPSGADMLQLATNFKATKKVNFISDNVLQNGQTQLTFKESIDGNDRSGSVAIPEFFYLGIPIFHNGSPYKVDCRLRYRVGDGSLKMWYEIVRLDRIVRTAFNDIKQEIADKCETVIFEGSR